MIFTVGIISPSAIREKWCRGCKRDGLVNHIDAIDDRGVNNKDTGAARDEITAAGDGCSDMESGPGGTKGQTQRRRIFVDLTGLDAGRNDFGYMGRLQSGDLAGADPFAFF
jgi:hypothetical protein